MTIIFHIDLNAFFASCEVAQNPNLKNKPVVVAGNSRRGIITTASYEARKYGIHSAMPLFQAKELCKNLIVLPVNMSLYKHISAKFFEIISTYSTKIEVASIDECYVDMSETVLRFQNVIELAKTIQNDVYETLNIGCSIGISHNKFLAKMASDLKKPNGITLLTKNNIETFLWPLPVKEMFGIGKKTVPKLEQVGIQTIGQLAKKENYNILKNILGKHTLIYINRANGIDPSTIDTSHNQLKSIGNSTTLLVDTDDFEEIKETFKKLSLQVSQRAKKVDVVSNNLSITIKYSRFDSVSRTIKLEEATNDFEIIYAKALEIFEHNYEDRPVRLLGICLNQVIPKKEYSQQLSLFSYQNEITHVNQKTTKELIEKLTTNSKINLTTLGNLIEHSEIQKKYLKKE